MSKRNNGFKRLMKEIRDNEDITRNWVEVIRRELPYKIPKDYTQWEDLSEMLSVPFYLKDVIKTKYVNLRGTEYENDMNCIMYWVMTHSPLFIITPDLLEEFKKIEFTSNLGLMRELMETMDMLYPSLIILFPKSNPMIDGSGGMLDYVLVNIHDIENTEKLKAEKWGFTTESVFELADKGTIEKLVKNELKYWVNWSGTTENDICHVGLFPIDKNNIRNELLADKDQAIKLYNGEIQSVEVKNTIHDKFANQLKEVVLQCLLILSSKPELLITTKDYSEDEYVKPKGFAQSTKKIKNETQKFIYPRVLNLVDYAETTIKKGDKGYIGKGTPQRSHWRKGYDGWRYYGSTKDKFGNPIPLEQRTKEKVKVKTYFVRGNKKEE